MPRHSCPKHGSRDIVVSYVGGQFDAPQPYIFCPHCEAERREREAFAARHRRTIWIKVLSCILLLTPIALLPLIYPMQATGLYRSLSIGGIVATIAIAITALVVRTLRIPLNAIAWRFHEKAQYEDIYSPRRYQPNDPVAARRERAIYKLRDLVDTAADFCFGWPLRITGLLAATALLGFLLGLYAIRQAQGS